MTARTNFHRRGFGALALIVIGFWSAPAAAQPASPRSAFEPPRFEAAALPLVPLPSADTVKLTPKQLRDRADAAEKIGDWEAAFTAYCDLHIADRSPEIRERLTATLRRVRQLRRHRDSAFVQYVSSLPTADAVNLFAELVAKLPATFAEPGKASPSNLWAGGLLELHRALGDRVFVQAFLGNVPAGKVEAFRGNLLAIWAKRSVVDPREARAALRQLIATAQDQFPLRVPAAFAIEFICGACAGLDEYTVFLSPARIVEPADAMPDLSAYGIFTGFTSEGLAVEGITPLSWAAFETPLRKGDRILKVNGRVVDAGGPAALAAALRTPINGSHEIELAVPVPGVPATIQLPPTLPTVWARLIDPKYGLGYIRISEFHANTPRELNDVLARLQTQALPLRGIILDLRGNHGGSFLAGVDVARRFLPVGLIVSTQGQIGEVAGRVFSSETGMAALDVPVAVLIDQDTASAAEVVAAALHDNNRAVLVGMPTFGKGTIQYPLKLTAADEGSGKLHTKSGSVRLTIARLTAPGGYPLNGRGVSPLPRFLEADPERQFQLAVEQVLELAPPMSPMMPLPPG